MQAAILRERREDARRHSDSVQGVEMGALSVRPPAFEPTAPVKKPRPRPQCKICKKHDHVDAYCPKRVKKKARICTLCACLPWHAQKPKCPECGQLYRDK